MAQSWPKVSKRVLGGTSSQAIISMTKTTRFRGGKHSTLGLLSFFRKTEAASVPEQVTSLGLPTYRLKVTAEK